MLTTTLASYDPQDLLIKSYNHWHLLLRPRQVTLGSLLLICNEKTNTYAGISPKAAREQHSIVQEIEAVLSNRFHFDKINYLMLMMVDPEVHFHVIPRYREPVNFDSQNFPDSDWPGPPTLSRDLALTEACSLKLIHTLRQEFNALSDYATSFQNIENNEPSSKYQRMYTSGCFDIFHQGHLNILKKSKALCHQLIVGVSTDELITKEKGRPPLIPYEERVSIIQACRYADEVIPQVDKNKQKIVDEFKIDAISVGSDWLGKYPPVSCDMVYLDYTPDVSSSLFKKLLNIGH